MVVFPRKLHEIRPMSEKEKTHFDCDACLWEGIDVEAGDYIIATRAFAKHKCEDYPLSAKNHEAGIAK